MQDRPGLLHSTQMLLPSEPRSDTDGINFLFNYMSIEVGLGCWGIHHESSAVPRLGFNQAYRNAGMGSLIWFVLFGTAYTSIWNLGSTL